MPFPGYTLPSELARMRRIVHAESLRVAQRIVIFRAFSLREGTDHKDFRDLTHKGGGR